MIKHELKNCGRCGVTFECKMGSILLCQCAKVILNDNERDYIKSLYQDCLCAACLEALKKEYHQYYLDKNIERLGKN